MKLSNIRMTGFRSIKGTESMIVDSNVTILIGANDHGKSNILAAIKCLNEETNIVPEDKHWDLPDDAVVSVEWEFKLTPTELTQLKNLEVKPKAKKAKLAVPAEENNKEGKGDAVDSDKAVPAEVPVVPEQVESIPEEVEEQTFEVNKDEKIVFFRDNKANIVKIKALPYAISIAKEAEILALRPRVELFESPSGNVVDQITLAQLEDPQYEFMQGIFRLAEIWDSRKTIFTQNPGTSRQLDEASTKLTEILNDKWNQGKDLIWRLKHTGTNGDTIMIEIEDPSINTQYSRPSLRSSGFRTYFLLSMVTLARTGNKPNNSYLFLFDEPGTYLHPHAQLDLQRSFEAIADNTQILYTTHSIFLINKNHPDRNRVISKHVEGTKIDQKPFIKNWKSIRESLGILLSNNFLIAEKTLLTEGPSDVIYTLNIIKELKATGKIDVDLNDLSIVDAGNSENYLSMCKLMLSEGRSIVALLDGDKAGKDNKKQLERVCEKEIQSKQLQIYMLPDDKSIEDIAADAPALQKAVEEVNDYLVTNNLRKQAESFDKDIEIKKIIQTPGKTLGQVIDEVTTLWFTPGGKISKLSIALKYEDQNGRTINPQAQSHVEQIQKLLGLRGEKSAESGVFEEVK